MANNNKSLSDITDYGFRGAIEPSIEFKDFSDDFVIDGISFRVHNNLFEVGYNDKNLEEKAIRLAKNYINVWIFNNNIKIKIDFNHTWKLKDDGGKFHNLELKDSVRVSERVIIKTMTYSIKAMARIVNPKFDSKAFSSYTELAEKSLLSEALQKAIAYYSQEILDKERPLYGVYKALEVLINELSEKGDGRELLAKLVGKNKKYVSDIMESTQHQRHDKTKARKLLSDADCRERTKELILAFANNITI